MRRLPHIVSFLLFIALCASAAYWAMQLFKPPLRQVAAPPRAAQAEIRADAAASLFGGRKGNAVAASNYQLRGVIFSDNPRDSVAIISADGKPPQAIRAGREVVPDVTVEEVHRDYVLLSEGGTSKRVDLPEDTKGLEGIAEAPAAVRPVTPPPPVQTPIPGQPIPSRAQAAAAQGVPPSAPPYPAGQPVPQQVPPAAPQAAQPGVPPVNQPVPGQAPVQQPMMTAPPTSFVNPSPAAPGIAPVVPGTSASPSVPAR